MRGRPVVVHRSITAVAVQVTVGQIDGVAPTVTGLMNDVGGGTEWDFTYTVPSQWPAGSLTVVTICADLDGDGQYDDACSVAGITLIDPSGVIRDSATGMPLQGASVTLLRYNAAQQTYVAMSATLDGGMFSPEVNPQITGNTGQYAWDVAPGIYQVRASKQTCTDAYSLVVVVPPPATDLDIRMSCRDLDADGIADYREVDLGTNPNAVDSDGDTIWDGAELAAGTNPLNVDSDGDTFHDALPVSHAQVNTNTIFDNCPTVANPAQQNNDANFVDLSPTYAPDDRTLTKSDALGNVCDFDDDNDGLPDATESTLSALQAMCPAATALTNPLVLDTDGDRVTDGAECALGSDPASALSKPAIPPSTADTDRDGLTNAFEATLGTNPAVKDTDLDGLQDGWEFKGYGSNALVADSDGDIVTDGCEAASLNNDSVVNPGDQALLAAEIARSVVAALKLADLDINRDGTINPGDQALQANEAIPGKCPLRSPWP